MLGAANKVLMLGWELPPRFAGGVGIVCDALTRALADTATLRARAHGERPR